MTTGTGGSRFTDEEIRAKARAMQKEYNARYYRAHKTEIYARLERNKLKRAAEALAAEQGCRT